MQQIPEVSMPSQDMLCERLDRLELSNRRLKAMLSILLCTGAVLLFVGAAAPKVVEAEKFILRDAGGVARGEIFANENGRGLVFFNKNGERALALLVSDQVNGLIVMDQNGNVRQSITSKMDGSNLSVYHPGSDSAQFEVVDSGLGTAITFRDRTNGDRVSMGISDKGAAVTLNDKNGAARAVMSDGGLSFVSFSKDGDIAWSPGWDKFSPEEQRQINRAIRGNLKQ